ncbi:putative secretory protein [Neofusicoccum parvum UCRNP2]|uniref:Putative secretory protein n=1 Tax=Botryosphaeria parva (strain UCR-NP2) TaxID=1287680 RepID=R1EL52_BOTPV|nr:putative secretory protein [Neofusicoccum parvum UCRNP2]
MPSPWGFQRAGLLLRVFALPGVSFAQEEYFISGPKCDNFASHYTLSSSEIIRAGISNTTANNVNIALNFERSNWATNSVTVDPFYTWPLSNGSQPQILPGSLLSVEEITDTSLYTVPPSVSLSRILYQTSTLNGTAITASAYVLWPYLPRGFANPNVTGLPVVGWAHGTSGVMSECAPSHIRNLWYQYKATYVLALQGYVVVAPDYAGLGVGASPSDDDDEGVRHPWLSAYAHANDLLYAVQAAQSAFPSLSRSFVLMGHSQGGGAAWAAATQQSASPTPGYLGTVVAAPAPGGPDLLELAVSGQQNLVGAYLGYGVRSQYPEVPAEDIFTEAGAARLRLLRELGGCSSMATVLFATPGINYTQTGWTDGWAAQAYANQSDYGGKQIAGPMLVLQGGMDPLAPEETTSAALNRTCEMYPQSQIRYASFGGVSHVPVLYAGQHIWLDWIEKRFEGVPVDPGCTQAAYESIRDVNSYSEAANYYLQLVTEAYEDP